MILLILVAAGATACGARTPQYGIFFGDDGSGTAVPINRVDPHHIDRAFAAAANLVGVDPDKIAQNGFVLQLHQGAFSWESHLYAGATQETTSRVAWYPCAFAPQSAMVHEFVHGVLFAAHKDADPGHTQEVWQHVDAARAALQALCAP